MSEAQGEYLTSIWLANKAAAAYARGQFRLASELGATTQAAHWQECLAGYHRDRAERGDRLPSF
jgi:hypothetical protein